MKRFLHQRSNRRRLIGLLFFALLYSTLIPQGFMPASDGSFSLQVCHSGLPDLASGTAHHSHGHAHADFCPYGALPAAGPLPYVAGVRSRSSGVPRLAASIGENFIGSRPERAHQARGPPSLA